jgi:polyhydroxybutyrate depolymerase
MRLALGLTIVALGCASADSAGTTGAGSVDAAPDLAVAAPDVIAVAPRDTAPPPDATRSATACNAMATPPSGLQTIMVNGKSRSYIIRPPKPYDPTHPYAVVFAFHGYQQTGAFMDTNSGPPYNFKTVLGGVATMLYPTALPDKSGNNSWARDIDDDLAFFDAMLAATRSQVCVDAGHVLAFGHSNGAVFANVIGCRRGNVVRGFAPVEGGLGTTTGCTAPAPAFLVHGDLDMLVSIGTGLKERDYWVKANGCNPQNPTPIAPAPCVQYQGCKPSPVVWCEHQETAYNGTGHGWPPWATMGMWTFFSGP